MLINIKIGSNNIITGWNKVPFDWNKPVLDVEDISTIHTGYSLAVNPVTKKHIITKVKKVKGEKVEEKTEIPYTCYTLVENKEEYEQAKAIRAEKEKQHEYEALVEKYIRQKYSLSQELAILRQRDEKVEEYTAYYEYAEECKVRAKAEVGI